MYVLGLPRRTVTPFTGPQPYSASPDGRSRMPLPSATRLTAAAPALWNVPAYRRPGFPSPNTRRERAGTPLLFLFRGFRHTGAFRRRRRLFFHGRHAHDLLDSRGVHGDDGGRHVLLLRLDPLGELHVRQVKGVPDSERRNVHFQKFRHVRRKALDLEGAGHLLEDAPLLDPGRLPPAPDGHLDAELLPEGDLVEIDVDHPVGPGVRLDILEDRVRLLRIRLVLHVHPDDDGPAAGGRYTLFPLPRR